MHSRVLFLDIETVPDRAVLPPDWDPATFPKPIQHQVVAISFVGASLVREGALERYEMEECRSGGAVDATEAQLLDGFWRLFARDRPRIVTWNGRGFDMPVLVQRAMVHGIQAATWHQFGDRWSGYRQRYSLESHCDLMEAMTDHGASPKLKLDEAALAMGLPGKMVAHGSEVADLVAAGRQAEVRAYCECDVLNLAGLYLRWAFTTGRTDAGGHNSAVDSLAALLEQGRRDRPHLGEFLDRWQATRRDRHVSVPVDAVRRLVSADGDHLPSEQVI